MIDRLRGLSRRMRVLFRSVAADRELEEELRFHRDMETEALVRGGLSSADARRAANVSFGGADRFGGAARDERGGAWLDAARQDLRLAFRLMRRNPQFTAAVVLTFALGIGANTAIFSVVDAVLLDASPFADADRLVMVWETDRSSGTTHEPASWPDLVDLAERSRTLADVGALMAMDGTLLDAGEPERVSVLRVTPNVPDLLGVRPLQGRTLRAGDGPAAGSVGVLLSERFWRRRFAGSPAVVGSTITINGRPSEVVGVLPDGADLGSAQVHAAADYANPLRSDPDLWLAMEPAQSEFPRWTHPFLAIGRLADAVSIADAQAELASIMADLERAFPENAARGVNVESYEEVTFGRVRRPLFVLLGAVVLVLLVACVNVANLLLARAEGRSREVAVRRALGASPSRIRGQFLVDSVLLTLLGAAGGLLLAHAALDTLVALAPPDIPRIADAALDVRVLAIATTASMLVCILFGLAPALDVRRVDLQHVLKAGAGRSATASHESRRLRESLVIAEVALAVALVISAGLLLRSFQALASVDPGFRTEGILKAEYQLDPLRYPMDFSRWPALPEINNFHATLLDRVGTLAGVRSAALAGQSPLDAGTTNGFVIEGREAESADMPEIRTRFITPGYLATLDVPLSAGRDISHSDVATSPRVALINRSAAERYFPGMDPAGHVLSFWSTSWRIVGVIGDERFSGVDSEPEPAVYAPLAQAPLPAATILLRTDRDAALLADDVRRTLRELDPALALSGVERLDVTLARTVARPRFIAVLLGLFAAVAASLAVIGVHGVISYGVARRTSEIGIRMALGATRASVLRLILAEGVALAAVGVAIGVVLAAAMARAVAALLFGVQPWDPATFGGVIVGMLACAVLASLLPARRAARAQPMAALRAE